jgi:hypothetical protein
MDERNQFILIWPWLAQQGGEKDALVAMHKDVKREILGWPSKMTQSLVWPWKMNDA